MGYYDLNFPKTQLDVNSCYESLYDTAIYQGLTILAYIDNGNLKVVKIEPSIVDIGLNLSNILYVKLAVFNDIIYALYSQFDTTTSKYYLKLAKYQGGTWTTVISNANATTNNEYVNSMSMCIDKLGKVHFIYGVNGFHTRVYYDTYPMQSAPISINQPSDYSQTAIKIITDNNNLPFALIRSFFNGSSTKTYIASNSDGSKLNTVVYALDNDVTNSEYTQDFVVLKDNSKFILVIKKIGSYDYVYAKNSNNANFVCINNLDTAAVNYISVCIDNFGNALVIVERDSAHIDFYVIDPYNLSIISKRTDYLNVYVNPDSGYYIKDESIIINSKADRKIFYIMSNDNSESYNLSYQNEAAIQNAANTVPALKMNISILEPSVFAENKVVIAAPSMNLTISFGPPVVNSFFFYDMDSDISEKNTDSSIIEKNIGVDIVAFQGDTIKLRIEFRSYYGELFDPDSIVLKIFENTNTLINTINIDVLTHKLSTGIYEYEYTVPLGSGSLVYEVDSLKGTSSNVIRGKISREWVR